MRTALISLLVVGFCVAGLWAAEPTTAPAQNDAMDAAHVAKAQELINNGVKFLVASREKDGGWSLGGKGGFRPAATALALKALAQHPDYGAKNEVVQQGFKFLLTYKQKNGAICDLNEGVNNYTTALAVMALVASGDPKYKADIEDAVKYLRSLQIIPGWESPDGKKIDKDNPNIGGVSYGTKKGSATYGQADGSNVSMWVDAMHDAGVKADDPAMQRALDFVTRLQNRSESNPMKYAADGTNDGGLVYAVTESKAGAGPDGRGLRSYGSMTYAGFKSMIYAGVGKKDPRVQAAYGWIRQYWGLDSNPNMPGQQSQQGLYYYYHVFAKALRAWGENEIKDSKGKMHNWRHELVDALAARVQKDGSWKNDADRWEEGSPKLVTAYALLALQETLKK